MQTNNAVYKRGLLAKELQTLFKPESEYSYSAHNYRSSPWLQIYDARHMKIDTTEYLVNLSNFHRLYQSLREVSIPHSDLVLMVNNPYAQVIRNWKNIPETRRRVLRSEYPEIDVATAAYLKWEAENMHISNIKEGVDDVSLDFAMFATGVKGIVNTATTAWKLFFSRKITTTAIKNAPKIEKVKNKLLEGEGKVGTYKELGKPGAGLAKHHMPAQHYMKQYGVKKEDGICMNVAQSSKNAPNVPNRHSQTRTFGGKAKIKSSLNPRDELAADIKDMKNIYQKDGLYNNQVRDDLLNVIKQNVNKHPEIFKKGNK